MISAFCFRAQEAEVGERHYVFWIFCIVTLIGSLQNYLSCMTGFILFCREIPLVACFHGRAHSSPGTRHVTKCLPIMYKICMVLNSAFSSVVKSDIVFSFNHLWQPLVHRHLTWFTAASGVEHCESTAHQVAHKCDPVTMLHVDLSN